MLTIPTRTTFLVAVTLSLSCSRPSDVDPPAEIAADPSAAETTPLEQAAMKSQPEVEAIMQRMADFYRQAESLTADIEQEMQMKMNGQEQTLLLERSVAVRRPNNLALYSTGDMPMLDIYQDEESLVMSFPPLSKYSQNAPLESFDQLHTYPMLSGPTIMNSMILSLIADNPYEALMDGVTAEQFAGREDLDGASVNHLRFGQDEFDWDAWIKAEGDPLLLRVRVDMSKSLRHIAQGENADSQMTMTETFHNWSINEPVDEDVFAFSPPPGFEKVDDLFDEMMPPDESSPLLGESAPPIELDLLDGGTFRLIEHAGKDIVMVDFWATWCGPCVQEIPLLVEIAEEYASKGVVLIAVNQREKPDTIREFLATEQLKMTVALDSRGEVGDAYQVQGLPTLALVDKEGVIQSVHVGYDPGIKKTLRREIDRLLDGESLVKDKPATPESGNAPE